MDKKTTYDLKYARERLKRVPLDLTHDDYAIVQKMADEAGESTNGYIKKSIALRMADDYKNHPDSEWIKDIQNHGTTSNKSTIINMFHDAISEDGND